MLDNKSFANFTDNEFRLSLKLAMKASTVALPSLLILLSRFASAQFQYISPVPNSKLHLPQETIILRNENPLNESSVYSKNLFEVIGSHSGAHACDIVLTEENRTILLKPKIPFTGGEKVSVNVSDGIRTKSGDEVKGISFCFFIRDAWSDEDYRRVNEQLQSLSEEDGDANQSQTRTLGGNGGFPPFTILTNTNPDPGEIFWHNFSGINTSSAHYCIMENNGDSVYGKFDTVTYKNWDLNHNGYLTAYNRIDSVYEMFDSNYLHIASFQCGNGYKADEHEFQIYPDGKPYLISFDPEIVDMTVYDPSYNPNATVLGLIIQQLDQAGNVIFQWRSWDHFNITDAQHISFSNAIIDAVHGNSIDVLSDGNILLSSRHLCEITKINRSTGDIIWRFGGANNQFTFTNDTEKISYQHDARILPNGHLTVFDNGNFHSPQKTSAKEYAIDEVNHVATLVWSYSPGINSKARGGLQTLPSGHRVICWGLRSSSSAPSVTEVDSNKNVVWEMQINDVNDRMHRSHRFVWKPCARPSQSTVKAKNITASTAKIYWAPATNANTYRLRYRMSGTQTWTSKTNITKTNKKISSLQPSTTYEYQIRSTCSINSPSAWTSIKTFTTKSLRDLSNGDEDVPLSIFPNPAHSIVYVSAGSGATGEITLTMYDVTGRIVSFLAESDQQQSIPIDISHLPDGVYFIEMKNGVETKTQKLVVE